MVGTKSLLDPSPTPRRDVKTKRHERSWCKGNRQCCGMGHKLMTDARFSGEARQETRETPSRWSHACQHPTKQSRAAAFAR